MRGYRSFVKVQTIAVLWIFYSCHSSGIATSFTWGFSVVRRTTLSRPSARSVKRQQQRVLKNNRPTRASPNDFSENSSEASYLEKVLAEYGWDDQLVTLSAETLPLLAEIQQDGAIQVGKIIRLEFPDDLEATTNPDKPPKFIVEMMLSAASSKSNNSTPTNEASTSTAASSYSIGAFKIDVGQLTTIWSNHDGQLPSLQDLFAAQKFSTTPIPVPQVDRLLDDIYETARHRSGASSFHNPQQQQQQQQRRRRGTGVEASWTKKQLQQRIDQIPMSVSFAKKDQIESALRQIAKAGPRHDQLVDSQMLVRSLPPLDDPQEQQTQQKRQIKAVVESQWIQRARAARMLDESGGGRFKRMPCLPVSSSKGLGSVTVINGGWLAVDSAVRAASEARALAQTGMSRGTNADERIVQRLEYLAMSSSSGNRGSKDALLSREDLQMDVREYLKAMDLPSSAEGAKEALIQMGIWSSEPNDPNAQTKPQPWSPEVLQAVEWYQTMNRKRKERLAKSLVQVNQDGETSAQEPISSLEGRIDLTRLQCICVDAARTSFRDDAIGVRPRASTGRKVSKSSKWEILLHTADVSDLYAPAVVELSEQLRLLQSAAAKRGSSRYDLPSGPLHLLPPSLLETLALETIHPDKADKSKSLSSASFNRCMTLWVYIDETTGELLDSGLERTLISAPLALTFQSATDLLQGSMAVNQAPSLEKAKALLGVVERDLVLWSARRRDTSTSAKAREERLKTREQVDRQIYGHSTQRDDGRDGFRRTRGHRLVDMCLEIHGYALTGLLEGARASLPYVAGAVRDGRVATAPLRRYIDGVAQRQALSVLCGYGGEPLSKSECVQVGRESTEAINTIANVQTFKATSNPKSTVKSSSKMQQQQQAARALLHKISQNEKNGDEEEGFLAMSTGKHSEVVILGVGAVASCKGIQGTLKPGEKVLVSIRHVNPSTGQVKATLLKDTNSRSSARTSSR